VVAAETSLQLQTRRDMPTPFMTAACKHSLSPANNRLAGATPTYTPSLGHSSVGLLCCLAGIPPLVSGPRRLPPRSLLS